MSIYHSPDLELDHADCLFQTGDIVRIKYSNEIHKLYPNIRDTHSHGWVGNEGHERYQGKTGVVKRTIWNDSSNRKRWGIIVKDTEYTWDERMLELVERKVAHG